MRTPLSRASTRPIIDCQCEMNWSIGFTGTTLPSAPGTPDVCGVEPMFIETMSYLTGGRPRQWIALGIQVQADRLIVIEPGAGEPA